MSARRNDRRGFDEGNYEVPHWPEQPQPQHPQDDLKDITLTCCDCSQPFVFTAGEQRFYSERIGPSYKQPRRCKGCRATNKERRQQRS